MQSEWKSGCNSYPEWADDGRSIEVFVTDELMRKAKLSAEDSFFSGESELETPVWYVRFENGQRTELVSIPKWRFA